MSLEMCGGQKSDWFGYDKYDFSFEAKQCCVVVPKREAAGRPWIWRARFFGVEPQTEQALLERGFHVAYIDVADLFGGAEAIELWNKFYDYLTNEQGFSRKVVLEGLSRGGLIVINWAAQNPEKVACIYIDAPVCDIKSWPGGKGKGLGAPDDWKKCLAVYGLSEEDALNFKGNPIDNLAPLARAGVMILSVCGGADVEVPMEENTAVLEERYKKLGGEITVILKKGVGHHPHSLEDPAPIVEFILKNTIEN